MTIKDLLSKGSKALEKTSETPDLDSEVLLGFTLKKTKAELLRDFNKDITPTQLKRFDKLIARRKRKEPVAYIVGKQAFYGLEFYVDKRVLIPRPETELMVDEALILLSNKTRKVDIVDVGTGSGCIPISLAINHPNANYFAIDISKNALQVTKKNVKKYKLSSKIKLLHGDLLEPLKNKVDVITANLPYLTIEQIKATEVDVQKYEPEMALLAGKTETVLYKKLLEQASRHLKSNGTIFLEVDPLFSRQTVKLAKKYFPTAKLAIKKDLTKQDRVLIIKT